MLMFTILCWAILIASCLAACAHIEQSWARANMILFTWLVLNLGSLKDDFILDC